MKNKITIVGAGPAGLAAGYYAKKREIDCEIFESNNFVGGNCHTFKEGEFFFDTGAHRLHDKIPEVTSELITILGEDLSKVTAPSYIFSDNKFFVFPFQLKDIIKKLGYLSLIKICIEIIFYKFKKHENNFENFALRTYGKTISNKFLTNYTEKLWGMPCSKLSTAISGTRLKGLNLKSYFKKNSKHLDGMEFYYPKYGYGSICNKLAEICGNVELNSKVTRIHHNNYRIDEITINNQNIVKVNNLISTLPLTNLIKVFYPAAPQDILEASSKLKFRNLILIVIFLNKESISDAATLYFPDKKFIFTRISEPKNRSSLMSPKDKTSLLIEVPCSDDDEIWKIEEDKLKEKIIAQLIGIGLFESNQILGMTTKKIKYAYPVLSTEYKEQINIIDNYLSKFTNLKLTGRNSKFEYSWLHDMIYAGKKIINEEF